MKHSIKNTSGPVWINITQIGIAFGLNTPLGEPEIFQINAEAKFLIVADVCAVISAHRQKSEK